MSNDSNSIWLTEALELAKKAAQEDEVPVGAVVIHEGKIIGRGYNRREQLQDPLAHAEVLALQEAAKNLGSWRLNDCTLVVTLEPCPMCLAACQQSRITQVIYGTQDPKGGALSLGYKIHEDPRTHHRFAVNQAQGKEVALCGEILSSFFKKKRADQKNR